MKLFTIIFLSFSAMAQTSYICEIDQLDEQYAEDSYLLVELSTESNIKSVKSMPMRTSHYDEMRRTDSCKKTNLKNLTLCKDSNKHNDTKSVYVSFDKRSESILWYGDTYNENYYISYNCKLAQ